jgi:hypothetical protein
VRFIEQPWGGVYIPWARRLGDDLEGDLDIGTTISALRTTSASWDRVLEDHLSVENDHPQ